MNVKLFRKIQKHILGEPRRFIMGDVIVRDRPGENVHDYNMTWPMPKCGTAACICGWACILGGKPRSNNEFHDARKLLGIDNSDALFYVGNWPEKYRFRWGRAKTLAGRARVAVQRIDHFIKTKGAD